MNFLYAWLFILLFKMSKKHYTIKSIGTRIRISLAFTLLCILLYAFWRNKHDAVTI